MAYIVLETHGGPEYAIVCMNDGGATAVFDTKEEAESFAREDCQRGIVVKVQF